MRNKRTTTYRHSVKVDIIDGGFDFLTASVGRHFEKVVYVNKHPIRIIYVDFLPPKMLPMCREALSIKLFSSVIPGQVHGWDRCRIVQDPTCRFLLSTDVNE